GQLVHETHLVVQPAGGVDDHRVGLGVRTGLDGVEGHGGRVGPLPVAADGRHADAGAPGLQLVRGGGAEGVGRAEDDVAVVGHEHAGELADGGRLAGAVDTHDQDAGRAPVDTAG